MASKSSRSKPDNETRARRQKTLEAPKEPRRPKTHWDHVLEEMVWLSKDFESERKWKLAQAKKVALRASKGILDQATKGEKKQKEEEQRIRKVALNISKDVKKFWMKIEKLVLYKQQLVIDEKKKKALDKQLEFLLGQTERYSTMLAENLVEPYKPEKCDLMNSRLQSPTKSSEDRARIEPSEVNVGSSLDSADLDEDFDLKSQDGSEDDEHTIEEDEVHITAQERQEELAALQDEVTLPLEELLKRYGVGKENGENNPEEHEDKAELALVEQNHSKDENVVSPVRCCTDNNGNILTFGAYSLEDEAAPDRDLSSTCGKSREIDQSDYSDEQEDGDFVLDAGEEKDDETTLLEEEELARADSGSPIDEIAVLQKESEIPIEELLARYGKDLGDKEVSEDESLYASALPEGVLNFREQENREPDHQFKSPHKNLEPTECKPALDISTEENHDGFDENSENRDGSERMADAAAAARCAQPTGFTFSTTKVRTKLPFLLKHSLREYQHIGLDWLVTMYEKRLNGILADEMGLGKTIMTIALLAHLACEKGIWGPHLIVVPTSVMLNWETEFLKWCPAFKILTYFGSAKERKLKRQGWMKPNSFHVCITTYRLVIQDSKVFKRKKWKYLILDEAHLIKNWKSQRWQTLLNFNSKRRILLTGTPLQNDLMELWSLMHFLMPHIFQSHQEFKDWFCNPITGMVEGQEKVNKEVVDRLHNVLRPFILRRLKRDVEKQLPRKHEHVIYCRLSKRQRNLYEDFIASSETQATLASTNFFGMINIIMQLRKVCNHPDLFEGRPIVSSFDMVGLDFQLSSSICSMLSASPFSSVDLENLGLFFTQWDFKMTSWEEEDVKALSTPSNLIKERFELNNLEQINLVSGNREKLHGSNIFEEIRMALLEERMREVKERAASVAWWNSLKCQRKPVYSTSRRDLLTVKGPLDDIFHRKADHSSYLYSSKLADMVLSPVERFQKMIDLVEGFMFAIPAARAPAPNCWCSKSHTSVFFGPTYKQNCFETLSPLLFPIRPAIVRRQVFFPDRRLIQFDCGKLQELAILLRKLKSEGHRALIFTQMTKMLDVLEAFINLYGYTYMRLDGSTQPEERQTLMQRFNTNPKIFLFILSTRSGGVGINLVGADTVIFYDSDWNPAMDQQAQDRCHRIGQTREVHIYRLISESTIEENILKKANQKRALDDLVIQSGGYNTEFFKKLDPRELFSGHKTLTVGNTREEKISSGDVCFSNADMEAALKNVEDEADYMALKKVEQEEAVDNQEFTEEAVERPEDDELVNEDDVQAEEPIDQGGYMVGQNPDTGLFPNSSDPNEERALMTLASKEEDSDMLEDVKQMAAAAAAAGQEIGSFESQLRPIDRYAIRYLELWDPVIEKAAVETEVQFEEREWELDHIEKLKEEMEAEIDDGEEPLVYEKWDAEFATEAYRQQVEALAQHQLMEDLEREAKEKELADNEDLDSIQTAKPRPKKKKSKKTKFKSLKKGPLISDSKPAKTKLKVESMSADDVVFDEEGSESDMSSPPVITSKKRKNTGSELDAEEGKSLKKKCKKSKKAAQEHSPSSDHFDEPRPSENLLGDDYKPTSKSKTVGKVSITSMPLKRLVTIRPEKLKKGNVWSRDCVPSPDQWLPQEDAIICAVVHEYGPNWSLVTDTLYGMTAGGCYRGRYRHPAHCCERYRELIQKYISIPGNPANDKNSNVGSAKGLLKVTEDNIRMLLNVAAEQPDTEKLLQKHFAALVFFGRKVSRCTEQNSGLSASHGLLYDGRSCGPTDEQFWGREPSQRMKFTTLNSKLVESALQQHTSGRDDEERRTIACGQNEDASVSEEQMGIILEFQQEKDDPVVSFPSVVHVFLRAPDPLKRVTHSLNETGRVKGSLTVAENRFRDAARACLESGLGWASSTFPLNDPKGRPAAKGHSSGKHKLIPPDSSKPPKSKQRKTLGEHGDLQSTLSSEPTFRPSAWKTPTDPNLKFDFVPALPDDGGTDPTFTSTFLCLENELPQDDISPESVMHSDDPSYISDLEHLSLSLENFDVSWME